MSSHLPTADDIVEFILANNAPVTRREIARAFNIKGQEDRIWLKKILKDIEKKGQIEKNTGKSYKAPEGLPGAGVVEVIEISDDGEVVAAPVDWKGKGRAPRVYVITSKKKQLAVGERALVRLKRINKKDYEGRIIHVLSTPENRIIGTFGLGNDGSGVIYPADKSVRYDFYVSPDDRADAKDGDLVTAEMLTPNALNKNRKQARVVEILGREDDPKMISLIAILDHEIPNNFPKEVIEQAEQGTVPDVGKRQDLRTVPLVTIDGEDARDFDDAVFAEPDPDPQNQGGWHMIVAIADVSFYVTPGSPLDREAYKRGNSTYFPDRVVPMLPEALSNDICSLRPHEPRACMAAHMWIDERGKLLRYKFVRGLMQSHARLTYEQVQIAKNGEPDPDIAPLMPHIENLYGTFETLLAARKERGALDLDLPERKAVIDRETGEISDIIPRERLDSHMLIEEFMVLTNVAAAMALEEKNAPCVYRVHDKPDSAKIDAASDFLASFDIKLDKGAVMTPKRMNNILEKAKGTDESELVSMMVLRSQSQAIYSPDNLGHFGLALEKYAHFTSPIRRYADLLVHRSMVSAWQLPGGGGLQEDDARLLGQMSQHISDTERRSMIAERDAMDRYTSLYLQDRVGNTFHGHIAGLNNAGLFVRLDETGADGLIPMRTLPNDYYVHNEEYHCLIGRDTGRAFRLMAPVSVKLIEADPVKGSMLFELLEYHGSPLPPKGAVLSQKGRGGRRRSQKPKSGSGPRGRKSSKQNTHSRRKTKKKTTTPKHKRKAKVNNKGNNKGKGKNT